MLNSGILSVPFDARKPSYEGRMVNVPVPEKVFSAEAGLGINHCNDFDHAGFLKRG